MEEDGLGDAGFVCSFKIFFDVLRRFDVVGVGDFENIFGGRCGNREIPRMSVKILRATDILRPRLCVAGELSTRINCYYIMLMVC